MSAAAGSSALFLNKAILESAADNGIFISGIGVSTSVANSETLASAGFSFVEENVRSFLMPLSSDSDFEPGLALTKSSKLPVEAANSFLPPELKCVGNSPMHEEIIKYAGTAFRRAEQIGIKTIVFGSGGARAIPDGFPEPDARKQFISLCRKLSGIAEKHNIVISLEPLNKKECNFINSVAEGGEIVKEVNHKSFRLLADIYHMLVENESPGNIIKYGNLLYHTHIAEKEGRSAPGVNKEDFTQYFRALKKAGYKGRLTIECNWISIADQAKASHDTLQKQISEV